MLCNPPAALLFAGACADYCAGHTCQYPGSRFVSTALTLGAAIGGGLCGGASLIDVASSWSDHTAHAGNYRDVQWFFGFVGIAVSYVDHVADGHCKDGRQQALVAYNNPGT
jgi:hypothetical protein